MVNLLFISSNNKIERIRGALQSQVKVKIDVVADFDFGLKDVFEKRPATVFIQDHIAGVTGESVARHIQMLLGAGAPSFVFLHDGNTKAKPVKGLFEYLIDLSNNDDIVLKDILTTLKSQLGLQWDKIYIPPKDDLNKVTYAAPPSPFSHSDSVGGDPFIDSTLDTVEAQHLNIEQNVASAFDSFDIISSTHDQLAEAVSEINSLKHLSTPPFLQTTNAVIAHSGNSGLNEAHTVKSVPRADCSVQQKISPPNVSVQPQKSVPASPVDIMMEPTPSSDTSEQSVLDQDIPADFVIVSERTSKPVAPEELLRVFEGSQQRKSALTRPLIILPLCCLIIVVMAWFVWKGFDFSLFSKKESVVPDTTLKNEPVSVDTQPISKPESINEIEELPSFVSRSGADPSYSKNKPGWERFVASDLDIRIYRLNGKIKALQVFGGSKGVNDTLLITALKELTGVSNYQISSRTNKDGIWVESAVAGQNDVLIYRNGERIKAFVVSINNK